MKPSLVVFGLGNPGKQYADTRHNAGFRALDVLAGSYAVGEWEEKQKFLSLICEARIVTVPVLLVKPLTFMNRSGEAVRKIVDFYKLDAAEQILILSDDIDLPLGTLRVRKSGGPGTHNGLRSLTHQFGEGYPRLRIGVGTPDKSQDLATWVLSVAPEEERSALDKALADLPLVLKSFVMDKHE